MTNSLENLRRALEPEHICLIIPPSPFLLDERVFASLGILKLAAVLEPHYRVSVLDLSGERTTSKPSGTARRRMCTGSPPLHRRCRLHSGSQLC